MDIVAKDALRGGGLEIVHTDEGFKWMYKGYESEDVYPFESLAVADFVLHAIECCGQEIERQLEKREKK